MQRLGRNLLLLIAAFAVVGVTAAASLHLQEGQNKQPRQPQKSRQMVEFEEQFPVADYDALETADPAEKERRLAKNRRRDKSKTELFVEPGSDVVTTSSHWADGLAALPAGRSAAVVIGSVRRAEAHMSSNKKRVYSEFIIEVEEVLKNDTGKKITPGKTLDADRAGGRVRFPGGKVGLYWVTGQGMPRAGGRYLLFLASAGPGDDLDILTGYELRGGRAYPLDMPGPGHPFASYSGAEETTLLNDTRTAIANP